MSLWRHAPAGLAAALAAATFGLLLQRERAHSAEMRALTHEIAALRADVAERPPASGNGPPVPFVRCGFDSDTIQAMAGALATAGGHQAPGPAPRDVARDPAKDPPGVEPPRTSEQEAALASATETVNGILKSGRVGPAEMARMGQQIAMAGPSPQTDALRAEIAQAINEGKLVYERHPQGM